MIKLFCLPLVSCVLLAGLPMSGENTEVILARMDRSAPAFTGVSADMKMTTYTKVLDDSSVESGTLKMQRPKPNDTRAVIDFSGGSDARMLSFEGHNLRIFYPKLNQYTDYDLGRNGNVLNQFLLLGFGSSGKDLASSYTITGEGTEKIAGLTTTKLSLVPKTAGVKEKIQRVELWIPDGDVSPVQQKFYEPSGNYQLVLYSNVVPNPSGQRVELKLPAGAKKQKK